MFFMKHSMQCFIGCLLSLVVEIWMFLWFFSFLPSWNYGCGWTQHDRLEFTSPLSVTPEASTSCFYWKANSPFIKSFLMQVIWWFWNIFFAAFGWWFWQIWFGENFISELLLFTVSAVSCFVDALICCFHDCVRFAKPVSTWKDNTLGQRSAVNT